MIWRLSMRILADWSAVRKPVKKQVRAARKPCLYRRICAKVKVEVKPKKRCNRRVTVLRSLQPTQAFAAPYTGAGVGRGYTPCFIHSDHASEFFSSNTAK
jgi:hypothetical protein